MEEWIARNCSGDCFFMWQVDPTVICGRNQIVDLEVNLDFCRANNIDVCRRKSGGGCVFADRNNIMFSYITSSSNVTTTFAAYTSLVAGMLRSLGLPASSTSRNDVMIGSQKVSGNAFYHLPDCGRSIVHGTMLYDADPKLMARAITPSRAKLEAKGVKSVASRITTIKEHSSIGLGEFKAFARSGLCGSKSLMLSEDNIHCIEEMAREISSTEWIFRKTSDATLTKSARLDGIGEFTAHINLQDNHISSIDLSGDFFLLADLDTALLDKLKGVRYSAETVARAIEAVAVNEIIAGLKNDQFVHLII